MGESKLRECPFCGGEAKMWQGAASECWYVECRNCRAGIMNCFYDKEEAVKAWNTRYEPPTPGGAIVPAGNKRLRG